MVPNSFPINYLNAVKIIDKMGKKKQCKYILYDYVLLDYLQMK